MDHKPLAGRVALVTGSGRGLGRAMAEKLAQMGAKVAVHDITAQAPAEFGEAKDLMDVAERIASAAKTTTCAVAGDVSVALEVQRMVGEAERMLGPIDILVNNAGGDIAALGGKPKPNDALGIPMDDVNAILDRNLISTMLLCRAVCPAMAQRRSGAVVNIGSGIAHYGYEEGVAYAVAKAGILHYTRCLAAQLRPAGVRVNAVSPGATRTARFLVTRQVDEAMMASEGLVRYAKPTEIAEAVAFLASDAASFIHGQVLRVDGGASLFAS